MATKRKHRRVRKNWAGCKCPPGSRKVSTCSKKKNGPRVCKGRTWGCLGVGRTKTGKRAPRFVKAICG